VHQREIIQKLKQHQKEVQSAFEQISQAAASEKQALHGEWAQIAQQKLVLTDLQKQLQSQLRKSQQLNLSAVLNAPPPASDAAHKQELEVLIRERDRLRMENAAFKKELSAFDASFFDEIEDLKYRHSEAVKQLKAAREQIQQLQLTPAQTAK
jgi:hypothetical protein